MRVCPDSISALFQGPAATFFVLVSEIFPWNFRYCMHLAYLFHRFRTLVPTSSAVNIIHPQSPGERPQENRFLGLGTFLRALYVQYFTDLFTVWKMFHKLSPILFISFSYVCSCQYGISPFLKIISKQSTSCQKRGLMWRTPDTWPLLRNRSVSIRIDIQRFCLVCKQIRFYPY